MKLSKSRYEALDGLRGVSALMVVFYHFGLDIFDTTGLFENNFFVHTSYAFVDFFFVLSGFVIGHTYLNKINNYSALKSYLIKRFARLYPLLLLTVICYAILKLYALYFTNFQFDSDNYGLKDLLIDTIEPLTFMNSIPVISKSAGLNPVSWSISAEMISYLIFGLIVLFGKSKRSFLLGLWSILCLAFIIYHNRYLYTGEWGAIRAGLNFGVGVLVYEISNKVAIKGSYFEYVFISLLIVVFYSINNSQNELSNLLLTPLFSMGVLIFSFERGVISKILKKSLLQFLGKISYSVYLVHFIILWGFYQLLTLTSYKVSDKLIASLLLLFLITVVLFASSLTYKFVELKGGRWIKNRFVNNK